MHNKKHFKKLFWPTKTLYLCESENVIDEQQDILSINITEVFCLCKTSKSNSHSDSCGFVHLSEDQGAFGFTTFFNLNNTSINHFTVEIISLGRTKYVRLLKYLFQTNIFGSFYDLKKKDPFSPKSDPILPSDLVFLVT